MLKLQMGRQTYRNMNRWLAGQEVGAWAGDRLIVW
jgi:hypothetical protein